MDDTGSTSSDPLVGPSSPLSRYSPRKTSVAPRPLKSELTSKQFSSPAKSFIMDTGNPGDASPWRIKVTVQAEPRDDGSPSKKPVTRTTTVPLKGGMSSPAKRPRRTTRSKGADVEESEMEVEVKRPQRKRKGTPMKRVAKKPTPEKPMEDVVQNDHMIAVTSSPTKKPVKRGARKSLGTMPTQRGKRLSQAREELEHALQDAVGDSSPIGRDGDESDEDGIPLFEGMQADMTAMNEDFTMVSVETLQSMKQNTSLLEDSQAGDRSRGNTSFWPSSPPQDQQHAQDDQEYSEDDDRDRRTAAYPDISAQARDARETPAKSFAQAFDAMSWRPTHRTQQEPTPAESSEIAAQPSSHQKSSGKKPSSPKEPEQWSVERTQVSQHIEQAPEDQVVTIDDEEDAEAGANESFSPSKAGAEDDIWAEEASRSLEESFVSNHSLQSLDTSRSRDQTRPHQDQAPEREPTIAEHLNDLFSSQPLRPARAKIPRTWRRSSGMDFSYVDSPAHRMQTDNDPHGVRKASGSAGSDEGDDRGSGVLTPPSTDEDENDGEESDEEMEDAEAEDEDDLNVDGEQKIGDAGKSVFEPDGAATGLQGVNEEDDVSAESTESDASEEVEPADGDDTGLFWQKNLPNVYKRPLRRETTEQKKAKDISSLLQDTEFSRIEQRQASAQKASSQKQNSPQIQVTKTTERAAMDAPPKRFPGSRLLAARRQQASSSFTDTSTSSVEKEKVKEKAIDSPLRRSLLKSSKVAPDTTAGAAANAGRRQPVSSSYTDTRTSSVDKHRDKAVISPLRKSLLTSSKVAGDTATGTATDGARSSRQHYIRRTDVSFLDQSVEDSTNLTFASKASDERQLLGEMDAISHAGRKGSKGKQRRLDDVRAAESFWQDAGQEAHESGPASSPAPALDYSTMGEEQDDYASQDVAEEPEEDELEEEMTEHTSKGRSYQEHLNVSSPQKIRVKFNDSTGNSSLLQPRKSYPPLFSQQAPPERTLAAKPTAALAAVSTEPSFLSRLSTTIWSTLIRPSGPTVEPVFPPSLRTLIRSRYGVLSAQHPWTMAHMRCLHRMMNSCTSGRYDSVIPKPGTMDLPSMLQGLVGRKTKGVTAACDFVLDEQQAHCIWALTQCLVAQNMIDDINAGEIEFIGDYQAKNFWGWYDHRHGSESVFREENVMQPKPSKGQRIGVEWVVRCVGNIVMAVGEKEEEDARVRMEREAWEKKNGFVHEDEYEEDEEDGGSREVLQKVLRA